MNELEKIKEWLKTFPDFDILAEFQVDSTDHIPNHGGIFPGGLIEISRRQQISGSVTVTNQLNFGIYYVFSKSPEDDAEAAINADWVSSFQRWVQEQSVCGLAPTFGNVNQTGEVIKAENGALYDADKDGTATYMVQLSIKYQNFYEVKNEWQI